MFSFGVDLCLLSAAFAYIWYRYYSLNIILPFYNKGNWLVIGIYALIMYLMTKVYGGTKVSYLRKREAMLAQVIAVICTNVLAYLQISLIGRDFMLFVPIIKLTLIDLIITAIWTVAYSRLYLRLYPPRRLVIIYGSRLASSVVDKMCRRTDKYMICESIKIDGDYDHEKVKEKILEYEGVIICDICDTDRNDILKYCFEQSVRVYITPKISDIIIRGAEDITLFDTPLILCRNYGLSFEQRFAKRCLDIVLSLVILPLAFVVGLICALAIKLYDGGTIFYRQKRLTLYGKEFEVIKFRSMVMNAEEDGVARLADAADDRITPVGVILRKFRLDEFPQLLNVLKGDMSLVGPRPERPELTNEYLEDMPEFKFRLDVKAGITGYAQVMGKYDTTPYDKLKMDLMYIERYSVLFDIKILMMTLKTMIAPGKTNEEEGIASAKAPKKSGTSKKKAKN